MKVLVGFDLHDTLILSTEAWLRAFKIVAPNIFSEIENDYMIFSRKDICKKYNINYENLKKIYRKNLKVNSNAVKVYNKLCTLFDTCIITNASFERATQDMIFCGIKYNKLYTRENGLKPNIDYIKDILNKQKCDYLIYIGNKNEDILIGDNIKSYIISKILPINKIYDKILSKEWCPMSKILLLSGPNKKVGYNEEIKKIIRNNLNGNLNLVCISASPNKYEKNDAQVFGKDDSLGIIKMLEQCDLKINDTYLIDDRNINNLIAEKIINADILYFMGGDPIAQNSMIMKSNLLNLIKSSNAFIMGVSAGSMNIAKKTFIPKYEENPTGKFIDGVDYCDITIVPHFNILDDEQVNEVKEFSKFHPLIGLPNDSGIFINNSEIIFINNCYLYK